MASLKDVDTEVPGVDENLTTVSPGDVWPLPHRGSRYTIREIEGKLRVCWARMDVVHPSEKLPSRLLKAMREHKRDRRGRFVLTPCREVIARREAQPEVWESVYLGRMGGVLSFPGFDLDPQTIDTGNLWTGLHFTHGEVFAVWNRDGNDDYLYWSGQGIYFRSIQRYPELCAKVRNIRPRCGRIYITENGHIWMNLPRSEVSYEFGPEFSRLLSEDRQRFSDPQYDILLRSVYERVRATGCYPVYVGRISDFDSGEPPRTHFSARAHFGIGGENAYDGDVFDSKYWRRMKRDY
jgi:hypothetical protein